ncbi:UDP-N-acetylmuramoylalanine--D-glutamate ligase [Helicobacter saguini]|uniref:UDP-N-acetylmuramoylalanine--D-glutamate ligase n=1 Tax=Helicobacter saguini TaxID=1548018 RepID=A0A347VYI4_9HELI|nr:cyanophycin synthetase [Helicobacter saguini]MWV61190.1 UDP-N-acetylmuramoylalanine--D-glutamate ligase [Helicobacter saguini]MWV68143.1 UDP-N-acetylmuramoylalanine--D-glutamate ligase [Helicobacter saguini]MWV70394.1 UDP-N-acetylmuramoylalanine--D-glutamate ligase [Helicobacter saguini]MWV72295.1 UDP-N-acetylmuramoylalanine--D-glutamate ligase [Helicobacter saguini]TLD95334.1 UDP-N-acetylmuramoylalanine--D-glutamate ligase [Helicobacter saguini]
MQEKVINIIGYGITNTAIVKLLNANDIKCKIFDDRFVDFVESNRGDSKDSKRVTESRTFIESNSRDINEYLPLKNVTKNYENLSIISPGISPQTPALRHFTNIISEYDFIFLLLEFLGRKVFSVWISGTNGKTTTTEMTALMMNATDGVTKSGGNIGTPLATLFTQDFGSDFSAILRENASDSNDSMESKASFNLESFLKFINNRSKHNVFLQDSKTQVTFCNNHKVYEIVQNCQDSIESKNPKKKKTTTLKWVLETSSFALHYTNYALPNVYILLPLSQDHISWHTGFDSYISDKLKPTILANYSKNPKSYFAIIPKELTFLESNKEILANFKGNLLLYENSNDLIAFLKQDSKLDSKILELKTLFKEPFLLDFTLSAAGLKFANVPYNIDSIKSYKIGNYRMQEVSKNGILFINDSKGTNPHAVLAALQTYAKYAIYLILGGDAKGASLAMLYPFLKENKVKVFCIGIDGVKINKECVNFGISSTYCETLENAMHAIFNQINYDFPNFIESNNTNSPTFAKDSVFSPPPLRRGVGGWVKNTESNLQDSKIIKSKNIDSKKDSIESNSKKNKKQPQKLPVIMLSPACASLDQYKSYKDRGDSFNALIEQIFAKKEQK